MAEAVQSPLRRPWRWPRLGWITLCAVLGVLAAEAAPPARAPAAFLLLAGGTVWFGLRGSRLALLAVVATAFAALHFLSARSLARFPLAGALASGQTTAATVTGVVADAPQTVGESTRFIVRCDELRTPGRHWALATRLSVRAPQLDGLHCGDLVELRGVLRQPPPPRNPGQFDLREWLRRQSIPAELLVRSARGVRTLEPGHALAFRSFALRCRDWIAEAITRDIRDDPLAAATVSAMVLGTREEIPEDVDAAFLHSGTLHIFSVSGLHVAMVALLIWKALNVLRVPRRTAAAVSIPLMLFYAWLTGWQPAAVRSALMASIVLLGSIVDRRARFANNLCLAALVVLAMDTQQLFQAGAQLSFFVLGAIAFATPWLQKKARPVCEPDPFLPRPLWTRWQRWATTARVWLAGMLATSLAAAVGSAPLTVWHFQLLTPVSLVANLVQVPLAFGVLAVACASALVSPAWSWLAQVLNNGNLLLARACAWSAAWFAAWPGAYFLWNPAAAVPPHSTVVTVFDVGEGGAALIRTASGQAWLIDTGRAELFRSIVRPGLNFAGVKQLDGLVLTHGDIDHVGGAAEAIRVFAPRVVVHPGADTRSPALAAALAAAAGTTTRAITGQTFALDSETSLRVLFAPTEGAAGPADDRALVIRLTAGAHRVLFTSDAGLRTEKWLLAHATADLPAPVLVRGKNRSDLTGSADFMLAVAPRTAVCAATDSIAGEQLPPAWRSAQELRGTTVLDQAESGAVTLTLSPDGLGIAEFLSPAR